MLLNRPRKITAFFTLLFSVFSFTVQAEVTPASAPNTAVAPIQNPEAVAKPAPAETDPENAKITLDFKEADINTVLRVMSLKTNMNIVAGPEVKGVVTIRLENVPWEKALQMVLKTYGYVYERDGNIIRITTRENLAAEPLVTQTFVLNYSKAAEVQKAVEDILTERGRIKIAERTNMLIITDISTNLFAIGEVLKKIDKPTPEAFIDSKIVNTSLGITENLGIEWTTGGTSSPLTLTGSSRPVTFPFATRTGNQGGPGTEAISPFIKQFFANEPGTSVAANSADPRSFPLGAAAVSNNTYSYGTMSFTGFQAALQMLKSRANTKIVSNPRIVVLNHQVANIHVGDNIPLPTFDTSSGTGRLVVSGFNYDKLKTGVTMEVIPHINDNREILVELQPSVNALGNNISFNADLSAPIINETTAKTQVLIESGQTIAIGGLLTDNTQTRENKVPYLGDLPVVGKLFRSKRQTAGSSNAKVETLFFVTVSIVDSEGQPTVENPGAQKTTPAGSQNTSEAKEEKKVDSGSQQTSQAQAPAAAQNTGAVEKVTPTTVEAKVPKKAS